MVKQERLLPEDHIPYKRLGQITQETKQVTPNVFVEDHYSRVPAYRGSNNSFVTTSEGVVMIDPPMMPTDAIRWRFEILKLNRGEVRYIINTDSHHDHATGNSMFPGIVVSSAGVRDTFPDVPESLTVQQISEIDPGDLHALSFYKPRPPTITFSERLTLYCGDHTFECYFLPGHTPHHIGVYCPQEKVFFAGDNCTPDSQPVLSAGHPLKWIESLKFIESLDINWVVGGHGPIGTKQAITDMRLFLQRCVDETRDAIEKGWTREQTAEKLDWEPYTGPAVHPGKAIQKRNVERFYDILSK